MGPHVVASTTDDLASGDQYLLRQLSGEVDEPYEADVYRRWRVVVSPMTGRGRSSLLRSGRRSRRWQITAKSSRSHPRSRQKMTSRASTVLRFRELGATSGRNRCRRRRYVVARWRRRPRRHRPVHGGTYFPHREAELRKIVLGVYCRWWRARSAPSLEGRQRTVRDLLACKVTSSLPDCVPALITTS